MTGLKHDAHSTLAQSPLELIARIEYGLAQQRWRSGIAVLRTMDNLVRETAPTGWTFFHLRARYKCGDGKKDFATANGNNDSRNVILTADV